MNLMRKMKLEKARKIISMCVALILVSTTHSSLLARAQSNSDNKASRDKMIEALVVNGYAQETAEALDESKLEEIYGYIVDGTMMDISTCSMEVDTLSEIENYLSCTEEELLDLGLTEDEIDGCDEQISDLLSMSNKELKQNFSLSNTEVKALRLAEENGIENKENHIVDNKKISNEVCASGALTSSDIKYTQSVANQSTSKKPKYVVNLSYAWKYVYLYACFDDKIAVAWGGKLNSMSEVGTAYYNEYDPIKFTWKDMISNKRMGEEAKINKGYIFEFPQSYGKFNNGDIYGKSRTGFATCTLYNDRLRNLSTKIVSQYCHAVIGWDHSISIGVPASGEITISPGSAYEVTSKRQTNIHY